MRTSDDSTIDLLQRFRTHLWIVALLFFGIGDIVTTSIGLQLGGFVEAAPVVYPLVYKHGLFAMIPLKVAAFGICGILYWIVPAPHNLGVPLGLAVLGVLLTGWNLYILTVGVTG